MRYYDPKLPNYLNQLIFEEKASEYSSQWYDDEPLDQQVYIKFKTGESVGCPHYIRGCDLECPICKKFYCCRMCHDESSIQDHTFPRYEVTTVRCKRCRAVQPINDRCAKCGYVFGCQYCPKCKLICNMGEDQKHFYHCDKCDRCVIGYPEHMTHCDKCN